MTEPLDILSILKEVHKRKPIEDALLSGSTLKRLSGGLNNTVYTYNQGEQQLCVKVYRVDDRHRAEREWLALQFLAVHQPGLAPTPLWFAPDPEIPAVGMAFVPGEPLHQARITDAAMRALADVLQRLYALRPDTLTYPYPRVGRATECVQRLEDWASGFAATSDHALAARVQPLIQEWLESDDRSILRLPAQPVFARGDPNLGNCLWDGTRLRLIDLEYAGWSDVAFELADLVEHVNTRVVADEHWPSFLEQFIPLDSADHRRFCAAQRTCALLWVMLLWPRRDAQMSSLLAQIDRTERLQRG